MTQVKNHLVLNFVLSVMYLEFSLGLLSTNEIPNYCGLPHGSIFVHVHFIIKADKFSLNALFCAITLCVNSVKNLNCSIFHIERRTLYSPKVEQRINTQSLSNVGILLIMIEYCLHTEVKQNGVKITYFMLKFIGGKKI